MDPSANPFASSEELRTSRGHRFRHSARTIAHLVSKFERLDTHRRSDASFAKSTSCLIPAREVDECHILDTRPTDQPTPQRNSNIFSIDSNASRNTLKIQRSQSLKTNPSARFGPSVSGPRHKSVAERRMMFEMGINDSGNILAIGVRDKASNKRRRTSPASEPFSSITALGPAHQRLEFASEATQTCRAGRCEK